MQKIVIVGGGFAGVSCAKNLCRELSGRAEIRLISDRPYHIFTPALYRVLASRRERKVCILLSDIFKDKKVEIAQDKIIGVDAVAKILHGISGKKYEYDYLVLALGSETAYFSIPGLREFSFGMKSIEDALRLKKHINEMFLHCIERSDDASDDICRLHFVVVGGGAGGVECAGELVDCVKSHAKKYGIDPSFVTIDLIEAAPRILQSVGADVSEKVSKYLHFLGVNIFVNRFIRAEEARQISAGDLTFKANTVVWTAGVMPNSLYGQIKEFSFDKKGRVEVDEYLRAKGTENIFVTGDGASTLYAGFAQTAIADGKAAAQNIVRLAHRRKMQKYRSKKPAIVMPVGPDWAVAVLGPVRLYGFASAILRHATDLRYFLSILPPLKALEVFNSRKNLCETCGICS